MMVSTRRSGATEPLESLPTPPKRTRKTKVPTAPSARCITEKDRAVSLVREASPEVMQMEQDITQEKIVSPVETRSAPKIPSLTDSAVVINKSLIPDAEPTPSATISAKRRHDEVDSQHESSPTKRSRAEQDTASADDKYALMFPKKHNLEDEALTLSEPPKSLVASYRRNRYHHGPNKRNSGLSSPLRRRPPVRLHGDNPFGIETFSKQELASQEAQQENPGQEQPRDTSTDRSEREDRSAAPEPETPSRSLFGSLRSFGSATIGRVLSPFTRSISSSTSPQSQTMPHPRTEPQKRVKVWEIQYPQLESQDENKPPKSPEHETESDRKRKTFEEKYGPTNRRYDHLHTVPLNGDPEDLPYPPKQPEPKLQSEPQQIPPAVEEFARKRREMRHKRFGKPHVQELPKQAPLFGPNSHYARGTKNPIYDLFDNGGEHPALRAYRGTKRTIDQALPEAGSAKAQSERSYQASVEDETEASEQSQEEPSTPVVKRQKTATAHAQTPKSALKAPGSVARSGRSARFNTNPVASQREYIAPAGTYCPDNIFNNLDRDRAVEDSPASNPALTPSPNTLTTKANTDLNTGVWRHPGDRLTDAINGATPADNKGRQTEYVWRDPYDPDWRPSLNNPAPSTFRLVYEDEAEEELLEMERMQASVTPEPTAQEPPATPRMPHAELPKSAAPGTSTTDFERENLERRRADATKTKPRKSSRLAEVTSARSRSPSPPGLDIDAADASDDSAKTPSPILDPASTDPNAIWTWSSETNEYISSVAAYPDFAYNPYNELIPSFCMRTATGAYDDTVTGPDGLTEKGRQDKYSAIYDDKWADKMFPFDPPQTYEEAGVGSRYIHDLIRKNDARCPELVKQADERFSLEWDAHQAAIDAALKQGRVLTATYPDRDGTEMQDADEEEL